MIGLLRDVVFYNFIENKIKHFYFLWHHVESVYKSKVNSIHNNYLIITASKGIMVDY